jgi:hypothetical protein
MRTSARAISTLIGRHNPLGRRILRQVVRVVKIRGRPSRLAWSVQARIIRASDIPLGFGELLVLDSDAHGDDRSGTALFHCAVVRGLAGRRVEISALHFAERRHRLPHSAVAWPHVDRVLSLTEADDERRRRGIVLHDGGEILIEHRAQARAIAGRLRGRAS